MNGTSKRIAKLLKDAASRASYIRAKLNVLIPSQIRALRLRRDDMTQKQLAELADMAQPRISAMERPGETNFNIDTLVRLAAAFKVGLKVQFVPFSEMLAWENDYSQDAFNPVPIERDTQFLAPAPRPVQLDFRRAWAEALRHRQTFEQRARVMYESFVNVAGSENLLIGTASAKPILDAGTVTYIEGSNPNPELAAIQAIPPQDLILIPSINQWAH